MEEVVTGSQNNNTNSYSGSGNDASNVSNEIAHHDNNHVATKTERTFSQNEVNDIVKKAKYGAVEDYKRINQQQPEYAQQKYGNTQSYTNQTANNFAGNNDETLRKIAAEEIQRQRDQWINEARNQSETEAARAVVNKFNNHLNAGKEKYEDFDKVARDVDYASFPHVVQMIADADNAADILYHLGTNRGHYFALEQAMERSPREALNLFNRLSNSLKQNEEAAKIKTPNEPLSQMRPSNTGTGNGALSVRDYRAKYRV